MFGTPELILFDSLRIVAGLASLGVIALTPYALTRHRMDWSQKTRFVGLAMLSAAIVGAYLEALGTVPAAWWRTALICAGAVFGLVGLVGFVSAPRRRHDR